MQRIVIIGAGQAAAWAVYTLRQEGFSGEVHVVSDEDKVFYERPPLSKQVLSKEASYDSLTLFPSETIEAFDIHWHKPDLAVKIDRDNQQVALKSGKLLPYDKLLIATGSRARIPVADWKGYQNIFSLRSISDCENLSNALLTAEKVGVVGGGWIGLEVAATIRKQGKEVHVFEMGSRLCARSVSPEVSEFLANIHKDAGTTVHLGTKNLALSEDSGQKIKVTYDGYVQDFDIVIVGAGAEIATELGVAANLDTKDGIIVNHYGQSSDENIFAAGDVAIHPELGYCIQSWANAQNQAIATAKSMLGNHTEYKDIPWLWSDQYAYNIQILGVYQPELVNRIIMRESTPEQKSFIYLNTANQLLNIIAVNDAKLIKLAKRWLQAKTVLDPQHLQDPTFNVMKLKP